MNPRLRSLLLAAAALGASATVAAAPASADPIAQCTATRGTIVAVDFAHWGGPIVRGCGVGAPTGYDLLHKGGFSTAGTSHDGPAFICRLGSASFRSGTQYPTAADEACVTTPRSNSYWSYWTAPAGQSTWSYSSLGAMSDHPSDGEVELWQFGATSVDGSSGQPAVTPAQLRAKNGAAPSTTQSTPRSTAAAATSSHRTTAAPPPVASHRTKATIANGSDPSPPAHPTTHSELGSASAGSSTASATPTSAAPGTSSGNAASVAPASTTGASTSSSTGGSPAPSIVDATTSAAEPHAPKSSPVPLVAGGALVALLGGGAGWTVLRRRRVEE